MLVDSAVSVLYTAWMSRWKSPFSYVGVASAPCSVVFSIWGRGYSFLGGRGVVSVLPSMSFRQMCCRRLSTGSLLSALCRGLATIQTTVVLVEFK